ncbi:hypothetical protein IFVP177_C140474 [Vibrio parahaemolyticus]|nr:hypothetical protein VDIAB_10030 [Vibrio diabolicus]
MNKINPYFKVNSKIEITRKFGYEDKLWLVVVSSLWAFVLVVKAQLVSI